MSWITLTLIPFTNGRYPASGTEKCLCDWGITHCSREAENMAQDNLGFDIAVEAAANAAINPEIFSYGDKIVIQVGRSGTPAPGALTPSSFSGGKIIYVGYRMKNVRSASGRMANFKYKFSNAWGYVMEHHVFQKLFPTWNGSKLILQPRSQIILGQSVSTITQSNGVQTTQMTIAEQVIEILQFTINQMTLQYGTPQFQFDPNLPSSNFDGVGGWEGYCPMDAANDLTCAEALKKTAKIIPAVSMWFDYSTTPPTFKIATRDTLPSVTLPWSNATQQESPGIYTSSIDRRDDLLPVCVDYKYRITTTVNGAQWVTIVDDVACAAGVTNPATGVTAANLIPFTEYVGAEVATFDFEGGNTTYTSLNTSPIPFNPATNSSDFNVWTQTLVSALSSNTIVQTGAMAVSVASGGVVTLSNPDGSAADSRYKWFMIGGPVPTGITDAKNPNLPQGVQLTLSCPFKFTEQVLSKDGITYIPSQTKIETKTVSIIAFSMAGGIFGNQTQTPEPIPFGLAAFVYNIENIVQYDGSHGVVEYDPQTNLPTITDICPIGYNLNLSGGLPEYLAMRAQVQTLSQDFMTGHTEVNFGVASHLGGTEMIERLRINRGPRWLYLISSSGGFSGSSNAGAVSGPTQLKDTQGATAVSSVVWQPPGGDGSTVAPGSATGNPGITYDVNVPTAAAPTVSTQPNYGNWTAAMMPNGCVGGFAYGPPALVAALGPTIYMQDPNTGGLIRISTTDTHGKALAILEYPCCWDFNDGNGTVNAWFLAIGCAPYKTSLLQPIKGAACT